MDQWTFLTNHGHVLLCIASDREIRMKDVAAKVGITERATQRIIADLLSEGYLTRVKVGRRNHYQTNMSLYFRHPIENRHQVSALLALLNTDPVQSDPDS